LLLGAWGWLWRGVAGGVGLRCGWSGVGGGGVVWGGVLCGVGGG